MNTMISALLRFDEIATSQFRDETRIGVGRDGRLISADEAGYLNRAKTVTVRGQSQTDENNAVRTALLNALKTQFGANNIPESVKAALKGSSLVGASDMKTDSSGKVVSGRPLTMRRIKAVMTAVKAELDRMNAVSEADVQRELENIEISGRAFNGKGESNDCFHGSRINWFFANVVNEAVKSAMLSGASGESVVDAVAKNLVRRYSTQSSPILRHYFPQLASIRSVHADRTELKAAVRDFLQRLGVDVNHPATAEYSTGVPELLFPKMPEIEVPAPDVNAPEMNAPEMNAPEVNAPEVKVEAKPPKPKFLVPSFGAVDPAVARLVAKCPPRYQNDTVSDRFSAFARTCIKESIESGAATRDEIAEAFIAWLKKTYSPTVNVVPAYLFPALQEPLVQSGIDTQPLRDQVREFLDDIGIVEK